MILCIVLLPYDWLIGCLPERSTGFPIIFSQWPVNMSINAYKLFFFLVYSVITVKVAAFGTISTMCLYETMQYS